LTAIACLTRGESIATVFAMTSKTDRPRLIIDVTDTVALGLWTGIQRVVRKMAACLESDPDHDVWLVAAIDGRFHRLNDLGRERLFAAEEKAGAPPAFASPKRSRKDAALRVLKNDPDMYLALQSWSLNRRYRRGLRHVTDAAAVEFVESDRLVLLDSFWGGVSSIRAAAKAHRTTDRLYAYIPDLIAITHPHYVPPLIATAFPRRLRRLLPLLDRALLTSHDAIRQLHDWSRDVAPTLSIGYFPLGSDVVPAADAPARNPITDVGTFVMVGTIEPRKGHRVALDAFDALWAAGRGSTLIFVGKLGWADAALVDRCHDHPELGRRLRLVHDASDVDLAGILGGADALIMASEIEGYGLPIVEALASGLPVIASDIPIFREVGGDFVAYFTPNDGAALAAAVNAIEQESARYLEGLAGYWPVTWQDASVRLLAAITEDRP
jgi:glycosyltransferase involved in cell wall biosynthesis